MLRTFQVVITKQNYFGKSSECWKRSLQSSFLCCTKFIRFEVSTSSSIILLLIHQFYSIDFVWVVKCIRLWHEDVSVLWFAIDIGKGCRKVVSFVTILRIADESHYEFQKISKSSCWSWDIVEVSFRICKGFFQLRSKRQITK